VAQGVGPEFKPQYCKNIKRKKVIEGSDRGLAQHVCVRPWVPSSTAKINKKVKFRGNSNNIPFFQSSLQTFSSLRKRHSNILYLYNAPKGGVCVCVCV
jgi:hypothetical protein